LRSVVTSFILEIKIFIK